MDINKRLELIKRNTEEILTEEDLKELLKKKKNPVVYLGTSITGRPHIGYFLWVLKMADFLKAGLKVKVLLADLHGALDNCPWEYLELRYKYYEKIIPLMFESLGVNTKNLEFVKGSNFQLKPEYTYDLMKLSSIVSIHDSKKAGSEVVKMSDNPKLSGLLYPLMQALDEQYLEADIQYGGIDQRKIFVMARENLPKIGYDSRIEIMTSLVPSLIGGKMSSSNEHGKIDLLDEEDSVIKKIKGAEMVAGNSNNGVIAFLENVIFVLKEDAGKEFIVKRDDKFGGDLKYKSFKEFEKDYKNKKIHPLDVKMAVAFEINNLLKVFRKNKKQLEKLAKEAFVRA